jgi:RNA polymerase sigma-70 factor (ECF subfamily)
MAEWWGQTLDREQALVDHERELGAMLTADSARCDRVCRAGNFAAGVICNKVTAPGFLDPVTLSFPWPVDLADLLRWLTLAASGREPEPVVPDAAEEESVWLARVAAGDEGSLQRLFDKWKHPLLGFFYRSLGSHADAEDLTLEVFVRLHRAAGDYRPTAKFSTYLFHIAGNLVRNEQRRRRRKPAQPAPPEVFETVTTAHIDDARRLAELEEILRQALPRVPEKYRTPLLLLQQQHLDYPAAAATLRITENSFRVLVHRGRQLLKTEMEAQP